MFLSQTLQKNPKLFILVFSSDQPIDQSIDLLIGPHRLLGQLLRQSLAVALRLCVFLSLRRLFDPLDQSRVSVSVELQRRAHGLQVGTAARGHTDTFSDI